MVSFPEVFALPKSVRGTGMERQTQGDTRGEPTTKEAGRKLKCNITSHTTSPTGFEQV